mgnify:CR=1 FL=1
MGIKTHAQSLAVLGLRGGGQMAAALISEYLDTAMIKLYSDSDMLRLPVYIDQVAGTREYTIPVPTVDDLEDDRHLVCMNRVTYDDPDVPVASEIISRSVVSRATYGINAVASGGSVTWKLELYSDPGDSVLSGLEMVYACTSALDDYVPPEGMADARDALTALLKHKLFSETGKPWTDPKMADQEMGKYLSYIGSLRIAAETDFTQRDLTATSAIPFII